MAGTKNASGRPRKSISDHLQGGTYRKDRHGEVAIVEQSGECAYLEISDPTEKAAFDLLVKTMGKPSPRMSIPFSIFARDLAIFIRASTTFPLSEVTGGMNPRNVISGSFRAYIEANNLLRRDFATFALSYNQQIDLMDAATRLQKTGIPMKPAIGKPMR